LPLGPGDKPADIPAREGGTPDEAPGSDWLVGELFPADAT
jgi:hypothetical protein